MLPSVRPTGKKYGVYRTSFPPRPDPITGSITGTGRLLVYGDAAPEQTPKEDTMTARDRNRLIKAALAKGWKVSQLK